MESSSLSKMFNDNAELHKLLSLYNNIQANKEAKMLSEIQYDHKLLIRLNEATASQSLSAVQAETLDKLHKNEVIASKLYIMLRHELAQKNY